MEEPTERGVGWERTNGLSFRALSFYKKINRSHMKLVPLLAAQRALFDISNRQQRFEAYLDSMLMGDRNHVRYPLLAHFNPMAKSHVPSFLDSLVSLKVDDDGGVAGAEEIAQNIIKETLAANRVDNQSYDELLSKYELSMGLVVVDDVEGGWTDRLQVEFETTFLSPSLKRNWVDVVLSSSWF